MLGRAGSVVRALLRRIGMPGGTPGARISAPEPWQAVVAACQSEIMELEPKSYYVTYHTEEMYYWLPIPEWIQEDGSHGAEHKTLDIGCGYGTLAAYSKKVLGGQVYCTDRLPINYFLTEKLMQRYGFQLAVCNIELDPFPWDVRFDTILLTEVLEHFNFHPLPTLSKIRGLLSDGGRVYLSTPDAARWGRVTKYYGRLDEIPYPGAVRPEKFIDDHVYQYTEDELMGLVDSAGFTVSRLGYAPGVPGTHRRHLVLTLRGA